MKSQDILFLSVEEGNLNFDVNLYSLDCFVDQVTQIWFMAIALPAVLLWIAPCARLCMGWMGCHTSPHWLLSTYAHAVPSAGVCTIFILC
jgi:hypothetical protein